MLQNNPFLIASGNPTDPTFPLQRSIRLRSSAPAYFNRTQTTTTNSVKCTFSAWVKRGTLGVLQVIFGGYTGTDADTQLYFDTTNQLKFTSRITNVNGSAFEWAGESAALFRDPSAWYHIVVLVDTSTAKTTNNAYYTVYVNNIVQTFTTVSGASLVSAATVQNRNTCWNVSGYLNTLGRHRANHFDGYLTEVNFVDGQALTPLSFGGYNPGTNVWEPRKYSGSYGTNGFYLNFQNPASTGADSSGNGNNFTPNNIQTSNSALVTYDSMLDVPTLSSGNNANFATLNPLDIIGTGGSITSGNLQLTGGTGAWYQSRSAFALTTGKWYWEVTIVSTNVSTNGIDLGIANSTTQLAGYGQPNKWVYNNNSGGRKSLNGTSSAYGTAFLTNNIVGVAFDADLGTLEFYVNGSTQGVAASTGLPNPAFPIVECYGTDSVAINFGQRPFSYTPPSGYKSLNTFNLPEPTIPRGDKYFEQYLYTGNGGGLQVGEIQKPMSLFNLDRSIRIRAAQNAYFSRLPTTNGNGQKFTISTWVKRGKLGTGWTDTIFTGRTGTNFPELDIIFSSDIIKLQAYTTGAALLMNVDTVNTYRNPAIWYHIVAAFDTTQTTPADRVKVYVNGVAQTIAAGVTYPSQNLVLTANQTVTQYIGSSPANTAWGDLYFADYYMIDGQQLTPTSFGQFDGNNYWTPKAYTGTYGTNGFHLEFEDFSGTTASTIGKDTSGNSNNWTPSGINLTTPEADNEYWDSYTDVPTLNDANTANYCVFDPLQFGSNELRNGNLTYVWGVASTAYKYRGTTTLTTGKWYFEGNIEAFTIGNAGNTNYAFGFIADSGVDTHISFGWTTNGTSMKLGYRYDVAGVIVQNVTYNTTAPVSTDIFGIEYDVDNGTANFYKNGTLMGSASGLALGAVKPQVWRTGTSNSATVHANFGQRAFKYTPSTGYKKINAFNVAEVVGDVETPDFVWIKSRSAATGHALFNSVSGVGKYLSSNATTAETTDVNSLIQFNKNGFLLGNAAIVNTSAATYVASAWKAGNTTVTNTDGSITSQVRANQIDGFSIITYTGIGSSPKTVGHGLGIAPKMVLIKDRNNAFNWRVWHTSLAATQVIEGLNTTSAASTQSTFNNTVPTSTVISLGNNDSNLSGASYLIYCFAEIAGFSKFGSYTGNGSTDGPFIYLGFRPRWVMIKNTTTAGYNWTIFDTNRIGYNTNNYRLFPNLSNAEESTTAIIDLLSNGFKPRNTDAGINVASGNFIYAAFAENPFKYSLAR